MFRIPYECALPASSGHSAQCIRGGDAGKSAHSYVLPPESTKPPHYGGGLSAQSPYFLTAGLSGVFASFGPR